MKIQLYLLVFTFFISTMGYAQTSYQTKRFAVKKQTKKNIRNLNKDYHFTIQSLESPFEGNTHYRHFLEDLKAKSALMYPYRPQASSMRKTNDVLDTMQVHHSFEGNLYNYSVPNDNTLAVNKDGIVLSAINTNIIFYDVKNDSLLKRVSLNVFSDTLDYVSNHQYDPKVIYDYQLDRFIVINLAGASSDNTTHIVVGFQNTDDVLGEWSFYALEGNPLNDTSWTDFPAISLSNDELFITGNLLRYGGSWQTSFKQSVIWQVDKYAGFDGDSVINTQLFHGISFNGVNIRNLHPVRGGSGFFGPEMYYMSNKNFAIQSDTFFVLKTTDLLSSANNKLEIKMVKSSTSYGAPPNPRMPGNKRLATNDARVLGAFLENDVLQFVGNTIDTSNGYATIYHGLIESPDVASTADLVLLKNDSLQFGYPNISYAGTNEKSLHAVVNCNYANQTINPGFCSFFFEKEGSYSDIQVLKTGDSYIDVLFGALQRWGDYSGSQPVYGEPGKVWVSGTYAKTNPGQRVYGTWISLLESTTKDAPVYPIPNQSAYVYPNPASNDYLSLVFDMPMQGNVQVDLVDINGRVISLAKDYSVKQGANRLSFTTLDLSNGLYVIRIYQADQLLYNSKLVIAN
jgi:hypothetical protein